MANDQSTKKSDSHGRNRDSKDKPTDSKSKERFSEKHDIHKRKHHRGDDRSETSKTSRHSHSSKRRHNSADITDNHDEIRVKEEPGEYPQQRSESRSMHVLVKQEENSENYRHDHRGVAVKNEHERTRDSRDRSHHEHPHVKTERRDDRHGYSRQYERRGRQNNDRIERRERERPNPSDSHDNTHSKGDVIDKVKPNFKLSGKLTEDTNTYKGVVIKYNEPAEARKPRTRWRLYIFKGEESLPMLPIHRQSAYLLGRDRVVADIPIDHPSCSKQHAVLQFRLVSYDRDDGATGHRVRPYVIDLESANGTFVNHKPIEARRYVELKERDVLKFGFSSREYVLLHENSKGDIESEDEGVQEDP